jgi:predicted chitinase
VTTITGVPGIDSVLLADPTNFNTNVLISQQPDNSWAPSTIYKFQDFVAAVTAMYLDGIGDFQLYLGDPDASDDVRAKQGLVNLALFLAQSMKETIQYDACDENNWSKGYPLDASCGQLGQDYADYDCEMACPRMPNAIISAVTNAKWYGAPGPVFCAPDSVMNAASGRNDGRTGSWNFGAPWCPPPLATAPGAGEAFERAECQIYEGQKAGGYNWDGSSGSVEGCCWWGRGVIQTTGRCNFGTLNHFLGATHLDPNSHGRPAQVLYPDIDFCADPEVICSSTEHPELKWIAGLFYWMSSVQTYEADGWNYLDNLRAYVDGGLTGTALIDAASSIVNRGCHTGNCETGAVDGTEVRRANFEKVLVAMGLH